MDTLLIAVTLVSLAIAGAMSLVVLRLLREDRRRSEARIAALLEAAGTGSLQGPAVAARTTIEAPRKPAAYTEAGRPSVHGAAVTAGNRAPREGARSWSTDLPLRAGSPTQDLFVEPEARRSWGPRIALSAGALAVLLGVGFTLLGPAAPGESRAAAALPRDGAASAPAPLELLTLRHAAAPGSLTVSGVVQNPRGGAPMRRVTAMVHVLDAGGAIVATHRAPIDLATFGPGEESPFHVTVPVGGAVARYRVGFRTEGGDVIAHVDRRTGAEALAHK
jgi:hypothetical protein